MLARLEATWSKARVVVASLPSASIVRLVHGQSATLVPVDAIPPVAQPAPASDELAFLRTPQLSSQQQTQSTQKRWHDAITQSTARARSVTTVVDGGGDGGNPPTQVLQPAQPPIVYSVDMSLPDNITLYNQLEVRGCTRRCGCVLDWG